jgi:hypothetical protein
MKCVHRVNTAERLVATALLRSAALVREPQAVRPCQQRLGRIGRD